MSYRSDIVIAIHKTIMARNLITNEFPSILKTEAHYQVDNAFYWRLDFWRWDNGYADVKEVEDYFEKLDEEDEVDASDAGDHPYRIGVYGAVRVGEDSSDLQEWGTPEEYGISVDISIDAPSQ